jgi:hypothetical protein
MSRIITFAALLAACGGVEAPITDPGVTSTGAVRAAPADPNGSRSAPRNLARGCPSATDPAVHWISQSPLTCAAALFQCSTSQSSFDDACGCGCIDVAPPTPSCPDASAAGVHYISHDPLYCAVIFFECNPHQRGFSDACGCGCID